MTKQVTGAQAGLDRQAQILVALAVMEAGGGTASISQIIQGVDARLGPGLSFSYQGEQTLREYVNRAAVNQGLVHPYDRSKPGWRITAAGLNHLRSRRHELPPLGTDLESTSDLDLLESRVRRLLAGELSRPTGATTPERAHSSVNAFVRSPGVKAWVLRRANGRCEACGASAPFVRLDGSPFLETHHLERLADGGPDTVENCAGVCPNCHRELHFGADRVRLKRELEAKVAAADRPAATPHNDRL